MVFMNILVRANLFNLRIAYNTLKSHAQRRFDVMDRVPPLEILFIKVVNGVRQSYISIRICWVSVYFATQDHTEVETVK